MNDHDPSNQHQSDSNDESIHEEEVEPLSRKKYSVASSDIVNQSTTKDLKEKQPVQQDSDLIDNVDNVIVENKIVKKTRSAFVFYQTDQLSKIRAELGASATMGETMTVVSE
jgi:hypothetical protein